MAYSKALVAAAFAAAALGAGAQVHRCTDAAGKVSFSDTACPSSAKQAARVLGADATDRRWENEAYGRQRNMESIEGASRLLREPTSDAVGDAGGGIIQSDPNERIRAQDDRNMQRRLGELEADRARRAQREERRRAAPPPPPLASIGRRQISNCSGDFCYDSRGGSYMRSGENLQRNDGKTCTPTPGVPGNFDCR
ncbi:MULTISPECIES: DUF4124 domain-containing protein [Variovorax]|uniref:DUF4124 domain-containing protein n=1 Tax=Variovorax TaxID=34072 RepID=UPI002859FF87|nr:DUF4124 domain-containing protein [Variovorax sp. 3319]MDR6886106.1 hypothetical protein [Variovorax sp. 3319]